eukprot:scaffold98864_cov59-Phaeocystis_antarctica.AAC.3
MHLLHRLELSQQPVAAKLRHETIDRLEGVGGIVPGPPARERVAVQLPPALVRREARAGQPLVGRVDQRVVRSLAGGRVRDDAGGAVDLDGEAAADPAAHEAVDRAAGQLRRVPAAPAVHPIAVPKRALGGCFGRGDSQRTRIPTGWHHYTGTHGERCESRSMRQKNVASPRRAEPSVRVLLMRARGRCNKGAAQYQVHSVRRACQSQRGVSTRPAAAYVSGR